MAARANIPECSKHMLEHCLSICQRALLPSNASEQCTYVRTDLRRTLTLREFSCAEYRARGGTAISPNSGGNLTAAGASRTALRGLR